METSVSRQNVIAALSSRGPLGKDAVEALGIPPALQDSGDGGFPSFSSDVSFSASALGGCFFLGLPLPERLPDYAIALSEKGGSVYCTLLDSRRRIIVNAMVGKAGDAELDFYALLLLIRSALRKAKELEAGKKRFRFIVASEDSVDSV